MTSFSAVKFRLILAVSMVILVILITGAFIFGYRHMQTVGEETAKRQADATASEDSIGNLKRLQVQLGKLDGLNEKLANLRTNSTLPQFETEKSLRTIAAQLGLNVRSITFVDAASDTSSSSSKSSTSATKSPQMTATKKNSKISFQFERSLSYSELIRFLDAIETSTPKLTITGVGLPSGSSRGSIDPGTLTLELATM